MNDEVVETMFAAAFAVLIDPASPGPNIPASTPADLAAIKKCTRMALRAALAALESSGLVLVKREATDGAYKLAETIADFTEPGEDTADDADTLRTLIQSAREIVGHPPSPATVKAGGV